MYFTGQSRSCRPQGRVHCGTCSARAMRLVSSCKRAKRAEPAAIGPAPPEQQRRRDREPQDEGQRVQQERLPAEAADQRAEQRHQVDDRQLRIGIPAQEDQRDRQERRCGTRRRRGRCGSASPGRRTPASARPASPPAPRSPAVLSRPDPLPQRPIARRPRPARPRPRPRRHRRRRRSGAQVLRRQLIAQIEGGEDLFDRPRPRAAPAVAGGTAWSDQSPQSAGMLEQVGLGEVRRARGGDRAQAPVVAVAEPHRDIVLDQHDPVKDAAAHIARALEANRARARRPAAPVARFQPAGQIGGPPPRPAAPRPMRRHARPAPPACR